MIEYYIQRPFLLPDFKLVMDNDAIINDLSLSFGKYFIKASCGESFDINLENFNSEYYKISYLSENYMTSDPLQEIMNIVYRYTKTPEKIFALHAGAVSYMGKANIFVAPTSNGKTTLVTYLIHNGFDYITDDCVLIDKDEMSVHPYPKPIHMRKDGYDVLKNLDIKPMNVKILCEKNEQKYVFTPQNFVDEKLDIKQIIFIEYNNLYNEIFTLKPANTIQKLMISSLIPYKIDLNYLKFLNNLSRLECKIVRYKDMNYIMDYLKYQKRIED
ncbi:MAG: hypothetical protein ACYCYI_09300 [Saccharofermentanales bacterium]